MKPLKMLIVEDNPDDADLLLIALRRAGFAPDWTRVQTEEDFLREIKKNPDIIISDYSMPQFDGLRAADLLQSSGLDVPFILISGTVGEDVAVEAMKHGITDYLLKDRTARLGNAVERALEQKLLREERRRSERALNLFRALVDRSSDGIDVVDPETGRFLDVNQTTCERLGYTREEILQMKVSDIEVPGIAFGSWADFMAGVRQSGSRIFEGRQTPKNGVSFPVEVRVRLVKLDREYLIASVRDITERKRIEEEMRSQLNELQRWHEAMLGREERIMELKQEVNELLDQQHLPDRYASEVKP